MEIDLPMIVALAIVAITAVFVYHKQATPSPSFLSRKRQQVTLVEKEILTHDTRRLRFKLPSPRMVLGLPVGKHIKLIFPNLVGVKPGKWNGRDDKDFGRKEVSRNYTPTTSDNDHGYFDLVLKIYSPGVKEKFPDGGKVSQQIDKLRVGDIVDVQGPYGKMTYHGQGRLDEFKKVKQARRVGMIAGGTGITPMLQVLQAILRDPADRTEVSLLFANQTVDDILLRDNLEALRAAHPQQFRRLHYTVDKAPASGWEYDEGFVTAAMIQAHLPPPAPDTLILCCGPPPMIKFACEKNLDVLHYTANMRAIW